MTPVFSALPELILQLAPGLDEQEVAKLDEHELQQLFRAAMNVRQPGPLAEDFLPRQDAVLRQQRADKGVVAIDAAATSPEDPRLRVWRGDITRLRVGAIVNAANNALLGCFRPGHHCIDNAIHSAAGLQLRIACNEYMRAHEPGYVEPTGSAMITPGFNLPADFVIHTVGSIVGGHMPTSTQAQQLASCYESCLRLARVHGAKSIALSCVSTGVFGFPKDEAARIAVTQARQFLDECGSSADFTIVFNVFSEDDDARYRALLGI